MNSLIKLQFNMKHKILIGLMLSLFSTTGIIAQCGFLPTCSSTNYLHFGMGSTTNATSLEYDNFVSAYHSTVVRTSSGVYKVWGEDMANDGATDVLAPTLINSINYPALGSASVLKVGLASQNGNTVQGVLLATDGLYAWSFENSILHTNITSSTAFQKLTINGQTDGLPAGVNPTDVKMMFATYHTLAIVTCSGAVYVITCGRAENTGTGITGAISAANAVKWFQVTEATAGNPNISNVIQIRGTENTLFALKSDGTLWTWGQETYLGNGSLQAAISRATLMTSPPNANPIKMIGATSEGAVASYYVLNADGNLYGLGGNTLKQLGDWTATDRTGWVQPRYNSAAGPVMNNIHWISPQEQTDQFANINVLTVDSTNYNWGHQDGAMLGRGAGVNGNYDPGIPGGLTVADKVLAVETGGHTSMLAKKCQDFFGYVGHRVRGSMGDGTTNTTNENVYTFATAIVYICGASTIDVGVSGTPTFGPTGLYCNGSSTNLLPSPSGGVLSISSGPATLAGTVITFTGTGTTTVNVQYMVALPGCSVVKTATTTLLTENCSIPPVAVTNSLTTLQNTVTTGDLSTNDTGVGASNSPTFTVTQPSATTGTITVNASTGGYTFTPNPSYVGSGSTTYTLCNNTGSCSSTTITYTVNSIPSLTVTASSTSLCVGSSSSLTVTGANSYTWNPGNSTGSTIIVTPSVTTIYTVTGANAAGITNTQTVSVTVNSLPTLTATASSSAICIGGTATLTSSGATTYTWNPSASTGTAVVVTPTATTVYTVTGTNASGCINSETVSLTVNTLPTAGITNSTGTTTLNCTTTSINVTATGGTSYAWSGGLGSSATATITNPGTYTVTATGANGCSSQSVITVSQNTTAPTVGITNSTGTTTLNCTTTSINVTATGGTSYTWSGGLGSLATATITNPGTYTVTATGANGCSSQSVITVSQNTTAPTVGITNSTGTTTLNCTTTAINVTATGGTSYTWSGGLGISATATITNPGTYTVTATGTNGCTSQSVIVVTQNTTAPTAGITNSTGTTTLNCITTAINVTATGGSTYAWSGGLGSLATATITNPGTYTVTSTGTNGCTSQSVIAVTQNTTAPTAGITNSTGTTTLNCTTTAINVTATGGTSYTWSGGLGSSSTATITNPGTYTVTATAANGCTSQSVIAVTQNTTAPTVGITNSTGTTTLNCTTTAINVTATGGSTYAWSGGLGSSST